MFAKGLVVLSTFGFLVTLGSAACDVDGFRTCYSENALTIKDDCDMDNINDWQQFCSGSGGGECYLYLEAIYGCFNDYECAPSEVSGIYANADGDDTTCLYFIDTDADYISKATYCSAAFQSAASNDVANWGDADDCPVYTDAPVTGQPTEAPTVPTPAPWETGPCDSASFKDCFNDVKTRLEQPCEDDVTSFQFASACADDEEGTNAGNCWSFANEQYECLVAANCTVQEVQGIYIYIYITLIPTPHTFNLLNQ